MKGEAGTSAKWSELRVRAEQELEEKGAGEPGKTEAREGLSADETRHLLHDLRVHQVELEMQNEELRRIQQELVAARDRYADLYDFAPVGYVTVSEKGLILEANLTLARMLRVDRGRLIRAPFSRFMARGSGDVYYLHRLRVFETGQPQACDVRMVGADGRQFWARLEAMPARTGKSDAMAYRAAVSDVSASKEAEEALRKSQEALEQQREELRALTARLPKTHESDRQRLSREMHDDLNQRLAMLTVDVESLEQRVPVPVRHLRSELGTLKTRLGELCDDVRRTVHQLHPSALEHLGLAAALRSYCAEFSRHEKVRAQFLSRGEQCPVPQEVALCIYRVAQEALHNAARHSGSARVTVVLTETRHEVRLAVGDHGKGFNPERVRGRGGLGLISMAEWVRLAGGSLVVKSRLGGGTQVRVRVPLGASREFLARGAGR